MNQGRRSVLTPRRSSVLFSAAFFVLNCGGLVDRDRLTSVGGNAGGAGALEPATGGGDGVGAVSGGSNSGGLNSGGTGGAPSGQCGEVNEPCCDTGMNDGCSWKLTCANSVCEDLRISLAQEKLLAKLSNGVADGAPADQFGFSVAVTGDTAIVGSFGDDDLGVDAGAAYVFVRSGSAWSMQQKLFAMTPDGLADGAAGDYFGWSVAAAGDYAIIGSPRNDDHGTDSGAVYVFVRNNGVWSVSHKLETQGGLGPGDNFGHSVSMSAFAAAIGSPFDDDQGADAGAAYVFNRYAGNGPIGASWAVEQKLVARLSDGSLDGAAGDEFGKSVALGSNRIIVGSHYDDDAGENSGSAYVFHKPSTTWDVQQKLVAQLSGGIGDGTSGDRFGEAVATFDDTVIIGAPDTDQSGFDSGSVYVFVRDGATWSPSQKLTATLENGIVDSHAGDEFGISVAISEKRTAIVGCAFHDDQGVDSGAAYILTKVGLSWSTKEKLVARLPGDSLDGAAGDAFGSQVAMSGDTFIVGTPADDDQGSASGSAYVFTFR